VTLTAAILYREELKEYDFGIGHPFRGDRYQLFHQFLISKLPEDNNYRVLQAEPATEQDLLLICEKDYIDFTREYYGASGTGSSPADQFFRFHSMDNLPIGRPGKLEEAARLVIGQAKMACNLVQNGEFDKVVSVGGGLHHAKRSYGEGFCLYNDVAYCALYLLSEFALDRILILDTDAHAGNGTAEYFYMEPKVLFIDIHQNPNTLYPGTGFIHQIGEGAGKGFTINIPMPVGAGDNSYKLVFDSIVSPVTREFQPQIIIRNGGSDPHLYDDLTDLGLTVKGFRMIGERVRELSTICGDRVIDLIASGYNRQILPYAWLALTSGLMGINMKLEEPERIPQQYISDSVYVETEKVVNEVKNNLKEYWSCLR
jgi:acetoin utilization protein AcuC